VVTNLGILATFKYFDFFVMSLVEVGDVLGFEMHVSTLKVILPVGISFYTFQTMSYTIDVYRGQLKPTSRFVDLLLYVSFFPQLVAGPIERGAHLLPQVAAPRRVDWNDIHSGAQLMLVGFFKKMVIADNMAVIVNEIFRDENPSGPAVILASYAFAFQIYGDFSGYTDIARGAARMLGFDIRENFRLPYFAVNPRDFWRRWHISLSSWLRDYLYIPLGGSRRGELRTIRNLAITMLLGGLWHGASWHFVVWGAYHGVLLGVYRIVEVVRGSKESRPGTAVGFVARVIFFFHLTCLGWFIFRVEDMPQLWHMLTSMVSDWSTIAIKDTQLLHFCLAAIPLTAFQIYQFRSGRMEPWVRWPLIVRVAFYLALFYAIVLIGAPETNEFLYFQF
jgi:D-alanyl-lipoteichoic acid acyltransferase DltB (MBOAT superfamily)